MKNTAFTLVEILIVVIILGILAAIVIPQFTDASQQSRLSSLQTDLQTVRQQLELYNIQHLDRYPDDAGLTTPAADSAGFWDHLMLETDKFGGFAPAAGEELGPYLMKIPQNAFQLQPGVVLLGAAGAGDEGWYFDGETFGAQGTGPDDEDLATSY